MGAVRFSIQPVWQAEGAAGGPLTRNSSIVISNRGTTRISVARKKESWLVSANKIANGVRSKKKEKRQRHHSNRHERKLSSSSEPVPRTEGRTQNAQEGPTLTRKKRNQPHDELGRRAAGRRALIEQRPACHSVRRPCDKPRTRRQFFFAS